MNLFIQQEEDEKYVLCGAIEFEQKEKQVFFYMGAKGSKKTKVAFYLTQFIFNSDEVNPDIDQYNSSQNEDVSRLFHGVFLSGAD